MAQQKIEVDLINGQLAIDARRLEEVIKEVMEAFSISYVDFGDEVYRPYRERRVVGLVRFDERRILFDSRLSGVEDTRTWAHELLSIYYYWLLGVIRHDDEVEAEARGMCADEGCLEILRRYQEMIRRK